MQLADLQAAFAGALRGEPDQALLHAIAPAPAGVPAQDRLAIYRRTSLHGQRSALTAVYPVVQALIGEALFAALVHDHLTQPGSRSGDLHRLGGDFAHTLLQEPACAGLPYLAEVARLEWALHDNFFAADRTALALVDAAQLDASAQLRVGLALHPSVRLLAGQFPVHAIWQAHQPDPAAAIDTGRLAAIDLQAGPVWLAVHRRAEGHCIAVLTAAQHALLADAQAGLPLAVSLERIEAAGWLAPDLAECLPRWLGAQLLQGFALY